MTPAISICIPTYHANGHQKRILTKLFETIRGQDFQDIEIIVSDHSGTAKEYIHELDIRTIYLNYDKEIGSSAFNTNNAIEHATGKYIKIINHDDFLLHSSALGRMHHILENSKFKWMATACMHTNSEGLAADRLHVPSWPGEKAMVEGINRIGCPSVSMFHRSLNIRCTPNYDLTMDCALWIDLYRAAGIPAIDSTPGLVIRMWDQQISQKINYALALQSDKIKMRAKYGY